MKMIGRAAQRAANELQKQSAAERDKAKRHEAARLQSQAALRLRAEKRLRRFLRDNPGWHSIPSVCEALDVPAGEYMRKPYYSVAAALVEANKLERQKVGPVLLFRKVVDTP